MEIFTKIGIIELSLLPKSISKELMMPLSVEGSDPNKPILPWLYFVVVCAALGWVGYLSYDLNKDLKKTTAGIRDSNDMIKDKMPAILDNTKKATDSLVSLTNDVNVLRNLVAPSGPSNGDDGTVSLAKFANSVLDTIGTSDLTITSFLHTKPAKQWAEDERKEALVAAFTVKNKKEMLDKICSTIYGGAWQATAKDGTKMSLLEWLKKNNTEVGNLLAVTKK
jgi:hypothetical protein